MTVTSALPVLSAVIDEQVPLLKLAIVKVVVVIGETFTVMVGAVPLKAAPFERVPESVPKPFTARDKVAVLSLQIVWFPLITPVGRGLIFTAALPVLSAGIAVQLPLVKVAMV